MTQGSSIPPRGSVDITPIAKMATGISTMDKNHKQQTAQIELLPGFAKSPTMETHSPSPTLLFGSGKELVAKPASNSSIAFPSIVSNTEAREKARILIIEDFPLIPEGIAHILNAEQDFLLCGKATDGNELAAISESKPDAVIFNATLPTRLELLRTIAVEWPDLPVLAHAMHDDLKCAERALLAGAKGFVTKSESATKLADALRHILAGELYAPEALVKKMMFLSLQGKCMRDSSPDGLLSPRELSVFWQIGQGRGTQQIAKDLNLSVKTIEAHRAHIKRKLELQTAPQLVRAAVQWVSEQIGQLSAV